MSRDGRLSDSIRDVLYGYDTQTDFVPGPLYNHPKLEETCNLLEEIAHSYKDEWLTGMEEKHKREFVCCPKQPKIPTGKSQ